MITKLTIIKRIHFIIVLRNYLISCDVFCYKEELLFDLTALTKPETIFNGALYAVNRKRSTTTPRTILITGEFE